MEKTNNKSNGKEKWALLKKIITSKDKLVFLSKVPTKDLELFCTVKDSNNEIAYSDFSEKVKGKFGVCLSRPIRITKPFDHAEPADLECFDHEIVDNTGNIGLWPCEELLSLIIILRKEEFKGKKILELGSGFSALASLVLVSNIEVDTIRVTDGNSKSVEYFKNTILPLNFSDSTNLLSKISCSDLIWNRNIVVKETEKFDFLIVSDCLFFVHYHLDLAITIKQHLASNGKCIIVSPPRGQTMDQFLKVAEGQGLTVEVKDRLQFDEIIKACSKQTYSAFLIELKHSKS